MSGYFPAQHGVKYTLETNMPAPEYPQVELALSFVHNPNPAPDWAFAPPESRLQAEADPGHLTRTSGPLACLRVPHRQQVCVVADERVDERNHVVDEIGPTVRRSQRERRPTTQSVIATLSVGHARQDPESGTTGWPRWSATECRVVRRGAALIVWMRLRTHTSASPGHGC